MTADLARPGDPYVTERGKMVVKDEEQRDRIKQADRFVPVIRNMQIHNRFNMNELPAHELNEQHAINAILVYQLHGLTLQEIAYILRIDPTTVQNIMHSSDYQITFENIFRELINVNSNSIRAKIADYSTKAMDNIIELAETADKDIVKLKANQDLLDRAGYGPEQMYGRNGEKSQDDDDILKIVVEGTDTRQKTEVSLNLKGLRK